MPLANPGQCVNRATAQNTKVPSVDWNEAARRFASVDVGDAPRPEIWTLVEW